MSSCYAIGKNSSHTLYVSITVTTNALRQNSHGCCSDSSRFTLIQISKFICSWLASPPFSSSPRRGTSFCNVQVQGSFSFLFYVIGRSMPSVSCSLLVSPDWPACWELVGFHVVRVWLPTVW